MKLVIDRNRWLRGEGPFNSALRRESDGKMCCLGFFALECGYQPHEIERIQSPATLAQTHDDVRGAMERLVRKAGHAYSGNLVGNSLMEINDARGIDEAVREQRIAAEFATIGVEVEFVD